MNIVFFFIVLRCIFSYNSFIHCTLAVIFVHLFFLHSCWSFSECVNLFWTWWSEVILTLLATSLSSYSVGIENQFRFLSQESLHLTGPLLWNTFLHSNSLHIPLHVHDRYSKFFPILIVLNILDVCGIKKTYLDQQWTHKILRMHWYNHILKVCNCL